MLLSPTLDMAHMSLTPGSGAGTIPGRSTTGHRAPLATRRTLLSRDNVSGQDFIAFDNRSTRRPPEIPGITARSLPAGGCTASAVVDPFTGGVID